MAQHVEAHHRRRLIRAWLFICSGLCALMVIVGGLTRLTDSGLSMVEWQPLMGTLPPLSAMEWERVFAAYRATPEYNVFNQGMTLDGFKSIFWLEYIHRLIGRLTGLIFAIPYAVFIIRGWLARREWLRFGLIFMLGGAQGVMGWYMVKSGLVDHPDVSPYRLAAHLGLGLLLFGLLLREGLMRTDRPSVRIKDRPDLSALHRAGQALLGWVFVTALSGALVAGLNAGLYYNTFPLMNGALVPDDLLRLEPAYLNLFENPSAVQFTHRCLAELLVIGAIGLWLWSRRVVLTPRARAAALGVMLASLMQATLGISTLLYMVPISLASAHQAGVMVLLGAVVWFLCELSLAPRAVAAPHPTSP